MRPGRAAAGLALGAAALAPRAASACSVCLSAVEGTREAYYGTTALLIVLPLVALAGLVLWLRRAARAADASRATAVPRPR